MESFVEKLHSQDSLELNTITTMTRLLGKTLVLSENLKVSMQISISEDVDTFDANSNF